MITKALPIPVVTPFSYISGHQALSLPFILFDLAVALSRRSRTSRIHKTIRFKEFVKDVYKRQKENTSKPACFWATRTSPMPALRHGVKPV